MVWFILPGVAHREATKKSCKFIARDGATEKLRLFDYDFTSSVVFSGNDFGVPDNDEVTVQICKC